MNITVASFRISEIRVRVKINIATLAWSGPENELLITKITLLI